MRFKPPNIWKVNSIDDKKRRNDKKIFDALNGSPRLNIQSVDSFFSDDYIVINGIYKVSRGDRAETGISEVVFGGTYTIGDTGISLTDVDVDEKYYQGFLDIIGDEVDEILGDLDLEETE